MRGLVPGTSPLKRRTGCRKKNWLQGLVPQTVQMKRSEEQVAGTYVPKIQTGLKSWDYS